MTSSPASQPHNGGSINDAGPESGSARWIILFTLASVNFTHILDSMIMMPLGGTFMNAFGINPGQFTLMVAAYAIGSFLSNLSGIFLLDLFDRKKAILTVYGGFLMGTFFCSRCGSYEALLAMRFITGLFGGMTGALVIAIVSDVFPYKDRGKAMGWLMAGFSAAAALGVPLGLSISFFFSWQMAFLFIAGLALLNFSVISYKFPALVRHLRGNTATRFSDIRPARTLYRIAGDGNQVTALLFGMMLVLGHMLIIPLLAPYMEINAGFSQRDLIWMYLIGGFLTVFTSPVFGRITDRYGPLRTYRVLLVLSFVPTLWVTRLGEVGITTALVSTSLFFIFGSGRMIGPQAMISATVGPETRGSFMSLKAALQQLSIALAALFCGWAVTIAPDGTYLGYHLTGYASVGILLCTLILAGRLTVAPGND